MKVVTYEVSYIPHGATFREIAIVRAKDRKEAVKQVKPLGKVVGIKSREEKSC